MGRWSFSWPLFSRYKPFRPEPGKAKPILTAFAQAFKNAFDKAVTCLNDAHAAAFIQSAVGDDLDEWGVKLKLPRDGDEADVNYGVEFFGPNTDYINVPYNVSLDVTTQLTVDMRFRIDAFPMTVVPYSRGNAHQEIFILATGAIQWMPLPGVTATSAAGVVVLGTWYHIRCIYDSVTGAEVYIGEPGGVFTLVASAVAGGLMTAGAWAIRIGQRHLGANPQDGVVDEIRGVAGVVPTVDGVTEVPYCLEAVAGTALLLHCDEGAGPTAADTSGFGNDGTLQGNADWFLMTATGWPGYRARLLARWQETATGLTVAAIKSAVNTKGATYAPTLEVADVQQYYKNGLDWPDDEDPWSAFGGLWGKLELFTGHIELDRIPTPEEALELRDEVYGVKPGPTRARLVTPGALLGATYPPYYTLRAESYNRCDEAAGPVILSDDFEEVPYSGLNYTSFGIATWDVVSDGGDMVMEGLIGGGPVYYPNGNIHNAAVVNDLYARVLMKLVSSNDGYSAGLALRVSLDAPDTNGDYYMVLIRRSAPNWQWGIVWRSGGGDTMVKNWTNISFDPTADYFPLEVWLERGKFAVKANGTVLGTGISDGGYASQGGAGPVVYGNDARFNDLYIW